jgi:hypothetical protein
MNENYVVAEVEHAPLIRDPAFPVRIWAVPVEEAGSRVGALRIIAAEVSPRRPRLKIVDGPRD